MNPNRLILRIFLVVIALTSLPCTGSLFLPWESVAANAKGFAIEGVSLELTATIEYWLRMMAVLRVIVGLFFFVASLNVVKYKPILPVMGWAMIFMALQAGYHGFRLALPTWPFSLDFIICGVCGIGIVWFSRKV